MKDGISISRKYIKKSLLNKWNGKIIKKVILRIKNWSNLKKNLKMWICKLFEGIKNMAKITLRKEKENNYCYGE